MTKTILVSSGLFILIAIATAPVHRGGHAREKEKPESPGEVKTAPDRPAQLPPRARWKKDGAIVVLIPAGPFMMGSVKNENEKPRREMTLPDYYLDLTEVTYAQYLKFCEETKRRPPVSVLLQTPFPDSLMNHPAATVTWEDAEAYCRWAGRRLPGEAEWEKACAGPSGRTYPWGHGWNGSACVNRTNSGDRAAAVGSRPACQSPYGILDLAGNVWEWTADWYRSYPGAPLDFDFTGEQRVVRGGAFFYSIDLLRCSARHTLPPDDASDHGGFRCAVTPGDDFFERIEAQ